MSEFEVYVPNTERWISYYEQRIQLTSSKIRENVAKSDTEGVFLQEMGHTPLRSTTGRDNGENSEEARVKLVTPVQQVVEQVKSEVSRENTRDGTHNPPQEGKGGIRRKRTATQASVKTKAGGGSIATVRASHFKKAKKTLKQNSTKVSDIFARR
jgi:hypothetical protein